MMRLNVLLAIFIAHSFVADCTNYYTVTVPGTIRSNTPYNVACTTHNAEKPINFKVDITGPGYNDSKSVEVEPHTSKVLTFDVPKVGGEDVEYKIKVEGTGGAEFKEENTLRSEKKHSTVLIQTDKALYKPGDLVRYRILFLDSNTRPAKITSPIDIQITDGKQNIIKQLKDVKLTKGVFSDEIQLSELPVLGKWNIVVDIDSESKSKDFGVEEYVLPKFEVIVDAEKHAYFEDGKIRATVRAKYTYGKPVKGTAEITVQPKYSYMFGSGGAVLGETTKTVPIDGKAPVEFELQFDRKHDWDKQMTITAVVEEKLTGNKQNGSADVTVHRDKYEIRGEDIPYTFEPGKPITVKAKVIRKDGTPPPVNPKQKLKVSISKGYNEPNINETEYEVNENGEAAFSITLPDIEFVSLVAKYGDVESHFAHLRKFTETIITPNFPQVDDNTPLKAEVKTQNLNLDKDIEVEVTANKDLDHFSYQVIGHGNIIQSDIIRDLPNKKRHTFSIKPMLAMMPVAHLYVQSIRDGELLWSESTIDIGEHLKNQIKIETAEEVKPGEDVNIVVKTSPNSFVGLLGVDQSVLLLKQGNDITKSDIFSELRSYDGFTHYSRYGHPGNQAGVLTFTNANYTLPPPHRPVHFGVGLPGMVFEMQPQYAQVALSVPRPIGQPGPIEVRKLFPQVWLWDNYTDSNPNGELVIKKKVPDTITSWVITGFSLDEENGIGLTEEATKLRVFQPFFVSTNLPYSVKRGEVIAIPVIVFNYLNKTLDVDLTMENLHDEFDFTEATNEIINNPKHDTKRSKHATIAPQSGESLSFMIRPKTVGHITIKLIATSALAGDAVLKMLQVDPEGVTEFVNKAVLVDLRETNVQKEEMTIEVPENAVPNSTHIEATVVGDLLGPTIKNLDNLVRKPYGCGEQNMVNFVPNILVMRYLENVGKLTPEIADKARKFMEIGYQRELTYKHDDGSYSAFGKSDKGGSTWLTAYVARSFRQAAKYIAIDESIIKAALEFLAKHQAPNGSFPEVGKVIDHQHASESDNGVVLTAFTVLAFLENAQKYPEYNENIEKALGYIDRNTEASGDIYALAIAAYAINVAKAPSKDDFLEKMETRATNDGGRRWWAKPEPAEDKEKPNAWLYWKPRSANVETTGYGLLAFLENGRVLETLPILKWLISQRNSNGGFESTQDTVVGLSALIKFAEKFASKDPAMTIDFNYDADKSTATVNKDNAIVLQSYELPPTVKKVGVEAKGSGIALVQVSYRYNVDNTDASPGFKVEPKVDTSSNSDFLKLKVCASYVANAGDPKESNMAVMEVNLPSGFTVDQDSLADIEGSQGVKKVEMKNSDTVAVIYFDSLTSTEVCPVVQAYKTHKVAQLKPAAVVVYDYYDDTRRARNFYSSPEASLCDICEGEECGTGCMKKEKN